MKLGINGSTSYLLKKKIINGNLQHRDRRLPITYRKVRPEKVKTLNPNGKVAEMLRELLNINA